MACGTIGAWRLLAVMASLSIVAVTRAAPADYYQILGNYYADCLSDNRIGMCVGDNECDVKFSKPLGDALSQDQFRDCGKGLHCCVIETEATLNPEDVTTPTADTTTPFLT